MKRLAAEETKPSVLAATLAALRPTYVALACISIFSVLIKLSIPLFVMEVINRVTTSRNLITLAFMLAAILGVILFGEILDWLRGKVLRRMSAHLDKTVGQRVYARIYDHDSAGAGLTSVLDFNLLRDTLGGKTVTDVMDAFLTPVFIIVLFLLHPLYGICGLGFVVVAAVLYGVTQRISGPGTKLVQESMNKELEFVNATTRNADSIRVMGILPGLTRKWSRYHFAGVGWMNHLQDRTAALQSISHFIGLCQYPITIALGATLYVMGEINQGVIFAGMILITRGVSPIYSLFHHWKSIGEARHAYHRLDALLGPETLDVKMSLPKPDGRLSVSSVYYRAGGQKSGPDRVLLNDITFSVEAGRTLAIVGQSGAGKSTLVRVIIGALRPFHGSVSLGGHDLLHWDQTELGRYIGYVPQEVDFLPGTVAENISRFRDLGADENQAVIEAARLAEVEDLIQSLPEGYNTRLGPGGHLLSGGERQKLSLARAVFGMPSLVVLDEPNSNLDMRGEEALGRMIQTLRERGVTVVLVTHKLNLLVFCDDVLVLHGGAVNAFGTRDEIINRIPPQRLTALRAIEGSR